MNVAVLMPSGITDEWRERARAFVDQWYTRHIAAPVFVGGCAGEWSKGEAIADALDQAKGARVFVLADADSYLHDPAHLIMAIAQVVDGGHAWAVPHHTIYRLNAKESLRLCENPGAPARLGWTCRPMYYAVPGGGITVITRAAFDLVGGIDARFLGWGGEDLTFGWALETLVNDGYRGLGQLVHLWHPHPAPNLRGSAASEALVATYKAARNIPRRMAAVVAGEEWVPLEPLATPVRFRMTTNRTAMRLPSGEVVRFAQHMFETTDPDLVEQLRRYPILREEVLR